MVKFIPTEKLSKKEKQKLNNARRKTWGALNPVTRKPPNPKAYRRKKIRYEDTSFDNGFFYCLFLFLIKYQLFLLPKRFFTKTTIATIAARRIITNGRIGVLSPVLTAVLAVEFDEPDV